MWFGGAFIFAVHVSYIVKSLYAFFILRVLVKTTHCIATVTPGTQTCGIYDSIGVYTIEFKRRVIYVNVKGGVVCD